ncbi:unnamed protein product [Menidia menidia]|uniref:(Atlantic silverside) hypothetical protein n=1 Tax=Menidia menidia TaxID=238744 RepID=A0A8S4BQ41_9TELE|nr:unnamed protein product [Menidia menidia]
MIGGVRGHLRTHARARGSVPVAWDFLHFAPGNEMSQPSQTTPTNLTETRPVTNLTLVVLLLIPCVVVLLLLNCFFLGYKLLLLSKRRVVPEEMRLPRLVVSDVAGGAYLSVSEPVLPLPVTSSRASSRDRAGIKHRVRLLRPDGGSGGSGSGSLRAPSSIRAASPPPADGFSGGGWWRSAPNLRQPGGSGSESRVQLVPPNSPTVSESWSFMLSFRVPG